MTKWMGVPILKCPSDLWIMQEIIFELKPDLIIETGTYEGGSAFYYANICDLLGNGRIISIDVEYRPYRPVHPRIRYVFCSSVSPDVISLVRDECRSAKTVLVLLDSDHSEKHVFQEMNLYKEFVTKGSYMIVEDTALNGHPIHPNTEPGPMEAVERFLKTSKDFEPDRTREKFLMTWHPKGFLKRV